MLYSSFDFCFAFCRMSASSGLFYLIKSYHRPSVSSRRENIPFIGENSVFRGEKRTSQEHHIEISKKLSWQCRSYIRKHKKAVYKLFAYIQLSLSLFFYQYSFIFIFSLLFYSSKNSPDFFSAGLSAIYTAVATIVEVTALMDVEATFHASVSSAAGLPRITSL